MSEVQLWQTVTAHLRALDEARAASLNAYERLNSGQDASGDIEKSELSEKRAIAAASEQLSILLTLRHSGSQGEQILTGNRRRKRKAEEQQHSPPPDTDKRRGADARKMRFTGPKRTALISHSDDGRREQLLQRGRKVAFRQPPRKSSLGVPIDEGEVWILATIIESINNDRNRYVVQDAEDELSGPCVTC